MYVLTYTYMLIIDDSEITNERRLYFSYSCSSPTATVMSGSDLNPCLDVNKITSVLSSFNLSMFFVSLVRASLMQSFKRATVSTRSSGHCL